MKVIGTSNYEDGQNGDVLVCFAVDEYFAKLIAELLNKRFGANTAPYAYKAVDDDYELYTPS